MGKLRRTTRRMRNGVFDSIDKVWIGDSEGPFLFDRMTDAAHEAALLNKRTHDVARFIPKIYEEIVPTHRKFSEKEIFEILENHLNVSV